MSKFQRVSSPESRPHTAGSPPLGTRAASLGIGLAVLISATGCSDDSEDIARKVGQVTESCALNSDCESPLVCVFERCHEPCNADSDCPYPARCVQSDRTNVFACQFPDEATCSGGNDSECNAPLVCAEDDQCRSPCGRDTDCPGEQSCTDDGVCAGEREVDDDGNLLTDGSAQDAGNDSAPGESPNTGGGFTDSGGDSDDADDDSASNDDDSASDDDALGDDSPPSADAGPDSTDEDPMIPAEEDLDSGIAPEQNDDDISRVDAGEDPTEPIEDGPDAGGESTFDYFEEEASAEPLPNDTREEALPLTNASIWLEGSDEDWFYVDVPDDGRAHIIEVVQTQGIDLISRMDVVAAADFSTLGSAFSTTEGATRTTYATVGPGTRTLLKFYATNRGVGRSDVTVSVTAEDDAYEPNPSRDEAAPIALDTDVTAQMIVPYVSATERSSEDYYLVELVEGTAVFRLLSTPSNLRYQINLLPIGEGATSLIANTTLGDAGSWEFDVPATGFYAIGLRDLENLGAVFQTPEAHLFESYSFRIEQ